MCGRLCSEKTKRQLSAVTVISHCGWNIHQVCTYYKLYLNLTVLVGNVNCTCLSLCDKIFFIKINRNTHKNLFQWGVALITKSNVSCIFDVLLNICTVRSHIIYHYRYLDNGLTRPESYSFTWEIPLCYLTLTWVSLSLGMICFPSRLRDALSSIQSCRVEIFSESNSYSDWSRIVTDCIPWISIGKNTH